MCGGGKVGGGAHLCEFKHHGFNEEKFPYSVFMYLCEISTALYNRSLYRLYCNTL